MTNSKKQPKKQAKRQHAKQTMKQPVRSQGFGLPTNKTVLIAIALVILAVPVAIYSISNRSNGNNKQQVQAQEQKQEPQQDEKNTEKEKPIEEANYNYTAQPGDTYSETARKAIQTYGINDKINLSTAQIIYAETLLTQEAGSPILDSGQKITIQEATVKSWVEKAQKLSDTAKQAWAVYTVGVDFNTNNVGEARD